MKIKITKEKRERQLIRFKTRKCSDIIGDRSRTAQENRCETKHDKQMQNKNISRYETTIMNNLECRYETTNVNNEQRTSTFEKKKTNIQM